MALRFPWSGLALAALAGLTAAPAWADIQARAGITQFGYTLIDLKPDDGIAPAIELLPPASGPGGSVATTSYRYRDARVLEPGVAVVGNDTRTDGFAMFVPLAAGVTVPDIQAAAAMSGSVAERSFAFSAEVSYRHDGVDSASRAGTTVQAEAYPAAGVGSFRLTPFTEVVWTGQLRLQAGTTRGRGPDTMEASTAWTRVSLSDADGNPVAGLDRLLTLSFEGPDQRSFEETLRLSFANASAEAAVGFLHAEVFAVTQLLSMGPDFAQPVPEPGTTGLMLCGLGVVAGAARRLRRRA